MSIDKDQLAAGLQKSDKLEQKGAEPTKNRNRGLPDYDSLCDLARTYLKEQWRHWPELVKNSLLPVPSDAVIEEMAGQFEQIYVSENAPVFKNAAMLPEGVAVGAVYSRYSDSNSNPRSLNQQLINELRGAAGNRVFAPWEYVLADAAVTGTNDNRRGYQLLKSLIVREKDPIKWILIDELGRASRDHIESLSLGRLVDQAGKRLVGVTDGFDSSNEMSKMSLSICSMINEQFVDQLKEKVERGMNDAFEQGKPLYNPGFGYRLVPVIGDDGEACFSPDGKRRQRVEIDPVQADQVRRLFRLYADEDWSPQRIARLFNKEQVGDTDKWTNCQIRNLLMRTIYNGREPWGKTTKKQLPDTSLQKTVKVPEDQWKWRDVPELRIIDPDLWDRAQSRLAELSRAYDRNDDSITRGEGHAKRLFHLFCHCCGAPLWASRGGNRPVVVCTKGRDGVDGCTATGSKTLSHIEESLLNYLLEQFANEQFVDDIVEAANEYLTDWAKRPKPDVKKIERAIAKMTKAKARIVNQLEKLAMSQFLESVIKKVADMETEIDTLATELGVAKADAVMPAPIQRDQVAGSIGSLRDLLYRDPATSGRIISSLVGRVMLEQIPIEGKKRPQWMAHFQLNVSQVMLEITRQQNCPSTDTWEFLSNRSWTTKSTTSIEIRKFTNAERIAKIATEMVNAGSSRNSVSVALGVDSTTVDQAIRCWEHGDRCYLPPRDQTVRRNQANCKSEPLGPEVVRLVDVEGQSFVGIAKKLGVTQMLVSRAYKQHKKEEALAAAKAGKKMSVGPRLKLPRETHQRIRELLIEGKLSMRAIAREVGCGHHAVCHARKRLQAEDDRAA